MIVTVTPNPALDKTLVVHGFRVGAINRVAVDGIDIGGKGINVARSLARFGCDVLATGFLGADDVCGVLARLAASGVQPDFVRVSGDIRLNLKILDPASGEETEINEAGPFVSDEAVHALADKLSVLAKRCAVMVFSGSLPPGVPDDLYARCIRIAAAAGVQTVLDTAGAALRHGIAAAPDLVKPNRAEAEELLGMRITEDVELTAAAHRFLEYGARTVVISLGAAGALSASADGVWRARPPKLAPRNTVGAGDAMVAALAYALSRSLPAPEALRLATALSSAAAASAPPLPQLDDLDALLSQVSIESLSPHDASASASEVVS